MAKIPETLSDQMWPLMAATLAGSVRQRAGKRKQLAEAALSVKDQLHGGEILHAWMSTHLERDRKNKLEPILLEERLTKVLELFEAYACAGEGEHGFVDVGAAGVSAREVAVGV